VTSITDLQHGTLRLRARRLLTWATRRGRRVLPEYEAERSTWWAMLRRLMLVAAVSAVALFYGLLVSVLPPVLLMPFSVPLVVLGLLVIWALPERPKAPVRALGTTFILFTVFAIIWPNYLAIAVAGLPWISIRRLTGVTVMLLLLICVATSKNVRSQIAAILRSAPWLTKMLLGFVVVQTVSTIGSAHFGSSISRFIDIQITWTGMFFAAIWYFSRNETNMQKWVNILLLAMAFLIVLGAVEYRAQHVLWANHIPSFLQVQDEAVLKMLTPHFRDRYRAITTFTSPLSYGEFLAILVPLVLHKISNAKNTPSLLGWVAFDIATLAGVFFSGARLGMVGYITAHAVYVFIWAARRWRLEKGGLIGPLLTLFYPALMLVLVIVTTSVPGIKNRVLGGGASVASNYARQEQFALTVPAVAQRPLFGHGPNEGAAAIGWRNPAGDLSIDSSYMSLAADYGLLGFALFFGLMGYVIYQTGRRGIFAAAEGFPLSAAMCATFVTFLTTRAVLSQSDNYPIIYMFLAVVALLIYKENARLTVGRSSIENHSH
jgi:hypothetical protein